MKQEIDNNAMWAAFRQELALQGELHVIAAIDNALNNLGFTIKETSTIIPIPLEQGEHANFRNKIQIGDKVTRNRDGVLVNLSQLNRVAKKDKKECEEIIPLEEIILNVWELGNYWKDLTKGVCNTEHGSQLDYIVKHWKEGEHYIKSFQKQGEQKPIIPKFRVGDIITNGLCTIQISSMDDKYYWHDNNIVGGDIESIDKEYKLVEQKPNLVAIMKDYFANTPKEQQEKDWDELNHWNNVGFTVEEFLYGKQKPAWSEEDERMLSCAEEAVKAYFSEIGNEGSVIHWLESLKDRVQPQSQWKPSEEMLEALYRAVPQDVMEISEDEMLLNKLYQGLKYGRVLSNK